MTYSEVRLKSFLLRRLVDDNWYNAKTDVNVCFMRMFSVIEQQQQRGRIHWTVYNDYLFQIVRQKNYDRDTLSFLYRLCCSFTKPKPRTYSYLSYNSRWPHTLSSVVDYVSNEVKCEKREDRSASNWCDIGFKFLYASDITKKTCTAHRSTHTVLFMRSDAAKGRKPSALPL